MPVDRLSEIYPPNYYSFDSGSGSLVMRIKDALDMRYFQRLLSRLPGNTLSVLDIGGGSGKQLDTVKQADCRITYTQIVDIDSNADSIARARGHDYFMGRIEDFNSDKKFDLIIVLNLIEHVSDPKLVLSQVRRLLSKDGIALFKTPNFDCLDARLLRHHNWGGYHCPRHWVLFNRASFESLAQDVGLRVKEFSYTQGAPFWSTTLLGFLAERHLIHASKERSTVSHPLFFLVAGVFALFDFIRVPFSKTAQMFFVLKRNT